MSGLLLLASIERVYLGQRQHGNIIGQPGTIFCPAKLGGNR